MRVFLSEHCTCGADPAAATGPLAAEGAAMLRALAADAAKVGGVEVVVVWAAGLPPLGVDGVEVVPGSPSPLGGASFGAWFLAHAAACDATLHIAPETDDLLASRAEAVLHAGHTWLGCWPDAIRLCGDKLRLAEELSRAGVPTPTTAPFDPAGAAAMLERGDRRHSPAWPSRPAGVVVKPRFGAGCADTYLARDGAILTRIAAAVADSPVPGGFIMQPACGGNGSCAARTSARGTEWLPGVGQQICRADHELGRLVYAGGQLSIGGDLPEVGYDPNDDPLANPAEGPAGAALRAVPGLDGWVGIDGEGSIFDINPRLTTSYLGYRALTDDNLAECLLFPDRAFPPVRWKPGMARFSKDGTVDVTPMNRDR